MSDDWFDDCQSEWGVQVKPQNRDRVREFVQHVTVRVRYGPRLSQRDRTRALQKIAKHSRELLEATHLLNIPDSASEEEREYRATVGAGVLHALRCALDTRCLQSDFPGSIAAPPRGAVPMFIIKLKRLTENLEKEAENRPQQTEINARESRTRKSVEKMARISYIRDLIRIYLHFGGDIKIGRSGRPSGLESFISDVTEKIPRQAVRKYFEEGLEGAVRAWIRAQGKYVFIDHGRIFEAALTGALRDVMDIRVLTGN
jgi:hypothetical protein